MLEHVSPAPPLPAPGSDLTALAVQRHDDEITHLLTSLPVHFM